MTPNQSQHGSCSNYIKILRLNYKKYIYLFDNSCEISCDLAFHGGSSSIII